MLNVCQYGYKKPATIGQWLEIVLFPAERKLIPSGYVLANPEIVNCTDVIKQENLIHVGWDENLAKGGESGDRAQVAVYEGGSTANRPACKR